MGLAELLDEPDEGLSVAVGHVDADVADRAADLLQHAVELFPVALRDAHRVERACGCLERLEECNEFLLVVVLVQRHGQPE